MIEMRCGLAAVAIAMLAGFFAVSCGEDETVILASGTTPYDTGLLDALEPMFEHETGYNLKVIPVGTGQAIEMGRRGDADVLFTHDPNSEQLFVDGGYGVNRQLVMHNDFVFVGPADDPAEIGTAANALAALRAIADSGSTFVSRGDDSGTNKLELDLWKEVGADPTGEQWYIEAGQGMGATLQIASQRHAYTISERGTFITLHDTLDLDVLLDGDSRLINIYHVMQVNPEVVDGLNAAGAQAFIDFMVSPETQALIAQFGVEEYGRPLFVPDAGKTEDDLRGSR